MTMTLKEQIDSQMAQLAAKDAEIAKAKADGEAAISALKADHNAKIAEAVKTAQGLAAEMDVAKETLKTGKLEREVLATQLAAQTARAESAESKLQNPAFDHASAKGVAPVKEVNTETGIETDEQFLVKYNAETDPAKRTLMYQARQKLLQKA
jgi:hypothetical protein